MKGMLLSLQYEKLQKNLLKHFSHRLCVSQLAIENGSYEQDTQEGTDLVMRVADIKIGVRVRNMDQYSDARRQEYANQITIRTRGKKGGLSEVHKLMGNDPSQFADYGVYTCVLNGGVYKSVMYDYRKIREAIRQNPVLFRYVVEKVGWVPNKYDESMFVALRVSPSIGPDNIPCLPKSCFVGCVGEWFNEPQQRLFEDNHNISRHRAGA